MDILIVEDDYGTVLDLKTILEKLGHHIIDAVSTGEEAIQLVKTSNPDLVLIDIELEGKMTGIEAAKIIHNNYKIPLIFITVFIKNCLNVSLQIGEEAIVISKPIRQSHLEYAISRALSEE